ncbi:hypothetical protein H9P43_008370 [Blastocladiella emersonii ATCC 22665]|nr:hypothetical protein H9P43_008370 [Blastocladiella emersonii ATCC 22665]
MSSPSPTSSTPTATPTDPALAAAIGLTARQLLGDASDTSCPLQPAATGADTPILPVAMPLTTVFGSLQSWCDPSANRNSGLTNVECDHLRNLARAAAANTGLTLRGCLAVQVGDAAANRPVWWLCSNDQFGEARGPSPRVASTGPWPATAVYLNGTAVNDLTFQPPGVKANGGAPGAPVPSATAVMATVGSGGASATVIPVSPSRSCSGLCTAVAAAVPGQGNDADLATQGDWAALRPPSNGADAYLHGCLSAKPGTADAGATVCAWLRLPPAPTGPLPPATTGAFGRQALTQYLKCGASSPVEFAEAVRLVTNNVNNNNGRENRADGSSPATATNGVGAGSAGSAGAPAPGSLSAFFNGLDKRVLIGVFSGLGALVVIAAALLVYRRHRRARALHEAYSKPVPTPSPRRRNTPPAAAAVTAASAPAAAERGGLTVAPPRASVVVAPIEVATPVTDGVPTAPASPIAAFSVPPPPLPAAIRASTVGGGVASARSSLVGGGNPRIPQPGAVMHLWRTPPPTPTPTQGGNGHTLMRSISLPSIREPLPAALPEGSVVSTNGSALHGPLPRTLPAALPATLDGPPSRPVTYFEPLAQTYHHPAYYHDTVVSLDTGMDLHLPAQSPHHPNYAASGVHDASVFPDWLPQAWQGIMAAAAAGGTTPRRVSFTLPSVHTVEAPEAAAADESGSDSDDDRPIGAAAAAAATGPAPPAAGVARRRSVTFYLPNE